MGSDENETGLSGVPLGIKNKYSELTKVDFDDDDGANDDASHHHHQQKRSASTKKYVLACAIFASLNSVLLGYGTYASLSIFNSIYMFITK